MSSRLLVTPTTSSRAGTILVVDDTPANLRLLERLLAAEGYAVRTASNGDEAIASVVGDPPDVVLMDIRMPQRDGFSACDALKRNTATRLIPVVLMTAMTESDFRLRAIEAGADEFLTKPIDVHELTARVRSLVRLKRYTDELDSAEAVILSLAQTVEARDHYTQGHCERLARYALAVGRRLGLPDEDLAALFRGGYLHDLGKIAIPDSILSKSSPLTEEEHARVREHPLIGDRLCGNLRTLERVRPIVRHHHERVDGSGYPDGLVGDAIPLLARIMSVVDVFDALTTERSYKSAWPVEAAYVELREEVRRGWRNDYLVETLVAAGNTGELDG